MREKMENAARAAVAEHWGHMLVGGEAFIADAVLAVLRQPTKAMIEVGIRTAEDCKESDWDSGGDGEQHNSYEYFRSDAPATMFTAMIDAARAPSS